MRQSMWIRALDYLIESCWLLALVAVPIFFDTMTVRIFEPDKIVLFRNIVIVMVVAVLVRAILAAPAAMARATATPAPGDTERRPWWREQIARRPLIVPVIIFVVVYTAATINSVLPGISLWGSYDRMQGLYTWLNYITFFFILSYSLRSWAQIERIISAFVFASVPIAAYGVIQHLQWDPIAWGADTSIRVASTLGNAIFLGAYLIMCMPLAGYRLWRAIERWRTPEIMPPPSRPNARARSRQQQKDVIEINGLPPIVPVIGYALVLVLSFAALYFCGSRGPYYGFIAAEVVFGFLLTVKLENPTPAIVSIALAVALYAVLYVESSLSPVLALLVLLVCIAAAVVVMGFPQVIKVGRPAIGGLALALAIFVFPQAINVFGPVSSSSADSQHLTDLGINGTSEVRTYIWEGSLHLIKDRPILGWGPEDMIYVYSKYYPSGLGHIEKSNAAPDRNHDEWLDFLVFSGVAGLAAWLAILGTLAGVGIAVLRRARSRRAIVLVCALAAVVVGHLAEATVGIDIVSTLMLLWTAFAVVTALYARPELLGASEAPALAAADLGESVAAVAGAETLVAVGARGGTEKSRPQGRNGRNGARATNGRSPRGQTPRQAPVPARISFDRLSGSQQGGLLGLIVLTLIAFIGGILLFANNVQVVRADATYKLAQGNDNVASECLNRVQNPNDVQAQAICQAGTQFTTQQIADYAGLTLIPTSISLYQQAIDEQPSQDMYYLWLGKTYLDEARYYELTSRNQQAIPWFQKAADTLVAATHLNPYNADHPMNLARMYSGWAGIDPSKWPLADKYYKIAIGLAPDNGRWADEWVRSDLSEASSRPGLTTAQRTALYRQALATAQHACAVDDLLGDARVYRGQAYEQLGMFKQAAASYAEALRIGNFELFDNAPYPPLPAYPQNTTPPPPPAVVQFLVNALAEAHQYPSLTAATKQLLPAGIRAGGPWYLDQSPITLAYSPTLGLGAPTSPFSSTLTAISNTLRQKGLVK